MKNGADWLAWSVQFVAGLFIGCLFGFYCFARPWTWQTERIPGFLTGIALVGAGLASRYGDQLWFSSFYSLDPPKTPEHNRVSRMVSLAITLLGIGVILFALLRNLRLL